MKEMTAKEKVTKLIDSWKTERKITTRFSEITDFPVVYIKHKDVVCFIEKLQDIIKTKDFSFFNGNILIFLEGDMKIAIIPQP